MDTHVISRPGAIPPHLVGLVLGVVLVLVGVALAAADVEAGVALACAGVAVVISCLTALDKARTLAKLEGHSLGDIAVPLPVIPPVSAHPHRDIAWLPSTVPAVVALPGGGWGMVPRDTATAAVGRPGFNGRWHTVAQPMQVYPAGTAASHIDHIPRDSAAVLVDCGGSAPWGATGAIIRSTAEGRPLVGPSA